MGQWVGGMAIPPLAQPDGGNSENLIWIIARKTSA
jgi:hypothetical protein